MISKYYPAKMKEKKRQAKPKKKQFVIIRLLTSR